VHAIISWFCLQLRFTWISQTFFLLMIWFLYSHWQHCISYHICGFLSVPYLLLFCTYIFFCIPDTDPKSRKLDSLKGTKGRFINRSACHSFLIFPAIEFTWINQTFFLLMIWFQYSHWQNCILYHFCVSLVSHIYYYFLHLYFSASPSVISVCGNANNNSAEELDAYLYLQTLFSVY